MKSQNDILYISEAPNILAKVKEFIPLIPEAINAWYCNLANKLEETTKVITSAPNFNASIEAMVDYKNALFAVHEIFCEFYMYDLKKENKAVSALHTKITSLALQMANDYPTKPH